MPVEAGILAELLCGRRPQEWSPILILRGVLVFFMVMASGMARGRARRTTVAFHDWGSLKFLHEVIFAQLLANGVRGIA